MNVIYFKMFSVYLKYCKLYSNINYNIYFYRMVPVYAVMYMVHNNYILKKKMTMLLIKRYFYRRYN